MTPEQRKELNMSAGCELNRLDDKQKALFLDVAFWRAAAMKEAKQAKRDVRFWQGHYLVMTLFAFALVLWIGFA